MNYPIPPKLAIIEDISSIGRCSLSVSMPIVSACRVQACPMPTAAFSNHTGYPVYHKTDLTDHLSPSFKTWEELGTVFDGIYCGYLGDSRQMEIVSSYIKSLSCNDVNDKKPSFIFVDPVLGDHGKLYSNLVSSYVEQMKKFISQADLITPNLTEACLLTGTPFTETGWDSKMLFSLCQKIHILGPKQIILTGIPVTEVHSDLLNTENCLTNDEMGSSPSYLCNYFSESKAPVGSFYTVPKCGSARPGTGDIFASIVISLVLRKFSLPDCVRIASDFISSCIKASDQANVPVQEGVIFERFLYELTSI